VENGDRFQENPHAGSELIETWIPDGGFKLERRKVQTPDGSATFTECLVPKWEFGELTPDQPCARQAGSGQSTGARTAGPLAAGDSGTESRGGTMGPDSGR